MEELNNNAPVEEPKQQAVIVPRPIGVTIIGLINLVLRGLAGLAAGLLIRGLSPDKLAQLKAQALQWGMEIPLGPAELKTAANAQMAVATIFIISGAGLLIGKDWARRLTLYFSLAMLFMAAAMVFMAPQSAGMALAEAIYPAIVVYYLTKKDVRQYFK